MSLLAEAKASQAKRGPTCSVTLAIKAQPDLTEEIQQLLDAVDAGTIYATTAADVLKAHDIDLGPQSIRRHMRQKCGCGVAA